MLAKFIIALHFLVCYCTTIESIQSVQSPGFTIVIATFERVSILERLLTQLTTSPPDSLVEILVIWQNTESKLPIYLTEPTLLNHFNQNVLITVRRSKLNSMNERFRPITNYKLNFKTRDLFILDDDLVLKNLDIQWAYEQYLLHNPINSPPSQGRIVGFTPRNYKLNTTTTDYEYQLQTTDSYSMILSNAAFLRIEWLQLYSEATKLAQDLRDYIDQVFNCDDILINFLVSNLTHQPPLLLQLKTPLRTIATSGLWNSPTTSTNTTTPPRPEHFSTRSLCLNHFFNQFAPFNKDGVDHYPLLQSYASVSQDLTDHSREMGLNESWEDEVWTTVPDPTSSHPPSESKEDEALESSKEGKEATEEEFDKVAQMTDSEFAIWHRLELGNEESEEQRMKELYQTVFGGRGARDEL